METTATPPKAAEKAAPNRSQQTTRAVEGLRMTKNGRITNWRFIDYTLGEQYAGHNNGEDAQVQSYVSYSEHISAICLTSYHSARKWKEQLKEWNFDKYLSMDSIKIIVTKAEKRRREEGKEVVFFRSGVRIPEGKIEFKERKIRREVEAQCRMQVSSMGAVRSW